MIRNIAYIVFSAIAFVSCKKDTHQKQEPIPATQEQLAEKNKNLSGTWAYLSEKIDFFNVSGIPSGESYPFNGSANFDGKSAIETTDLEGTKKRSTYSLSGMDGQFYIDLNGDNSIPRKCKIILLSPDSLKIQNTITGTDTSMRLVYTQIFVKANIADITNNIFRVTVSPFKARDFLYNFNVDIKIFITHKGAQEQLAESKKGITQTYSYAYSPNPGDEVRIALSGLNEYGNGPVVQCLATYKGVPYGKDWHSSGISSALNKAWTIVN